MVGNLAARSDILEALVTTENLIINESLLSLPRRHFCAISSF